jgi:formylglycine-generating enzyme required for sulfatase activity
MPRSTCHRTLAPLTLALLAGCVAARPAVRAPPGMSRLAGGDFMMGTDESELPELERRFPGLPAGFFRSETPRHVVSLDPFFLDQTEVTNAQFLAFVTAHPEWRPGAVPARYHNGAYLQNWVNGQSPPGLGDHPVTFVSWYAATAYCQAAGKRLPLEAEWEYAASGGASGWEYPWGNHPPDAWRANWDGTHIGTTTPAGTYRQGPAGLADLAGNVWEYMQDAWSDEYQVSPRPPQAPMTKEEIEQVQGRRVIRGGSFEGQAVNLRARYRDSHPATGAARHVGFRCAQTAGPDRPADSSVQFPSPY